MLFINLLCLLYLMVLIDSHTISKSIDNNYKINDNIFDTINEVDQPNPKTRRDKYHRYKLYYSKDNDVAVTDDYKGTKPFTDLERATDKIPVTATPKLTTEYGKHHKSSKRRVGSFWRKLRGKDKKKEFKHDIDVDRKKRIPNHKKEPDKKDNLTKNDSRNPTPRTKGKKKNRRKISNSPQQSEAKVTKRDVIGQYLQSTKPYTTTPQPSPLPMETLPQIEVLKSENKDIDAPIRDEREKEKSLEEDFLDLSEQLDNITLNLSNLKAKYGIVKTLNPTYESSSLYSAEHLKLIASSTPFTVSTTVGPHYQGTAVIEDMVNNLKLKSANIASGQKPALMSLISIATTVAAFDAYPILRRVGAPGSGDFFKSVTVLTPPVYDLSTFLSINKTANEHIDKKRTVALTESDDISLNNSLFITNTESHNVATRSIKEDTMTIAQNVEDMLQRELKNIYNKVKHKVSSDFRKEVHETKSTLKEGYNKITSKSTSKHPTTPFPTKTQCPCKSVVPQRKEKPATTSPRVKKKDDQDKDVSMDDTSATLSRANRSYDDYMMLNVYEQEMLAKTRGDNTNKMPTFTESPLLPKNKREVFRLSKRNPETLTDVQLREIIQKLYDDGANIPEYDYIEPMVNVFNFSKTKPKHNYSHNYNDVDYIVEAPSMPANRSLELDKPPIDADNPVSIIDSIYEDTANTAKDTSLEGLSNKISYKKFVDGYRHYLKFQKDQNRQNFSNLVKYQAHRHHSVDSIGKYILDKIPPVPSSSGLKRLKRFSDETENNMDYQEITTKSDDSWFRKHFYLFIDNGPPKKFHTSQTMKLKSPKDQKLYMTDPTAKPGVPGQPLYVHIDADAAGRKAKMSPKVCLDDLSKILDNIKDKQSSVSEAELKAQTNPFMPYSVGDNSIHSRSFIGKLFNGKRRRDDKKESTTTYYPITDYMLTENMPERMKRSITIDEFKSTLMDDFINKDLEEKVTTFSPNLNKEVLADAPQSKESNKYGYVDIDLVPRQTAVVKLRENAKKSRIKSFFKKFQFYRKKKKPKPKRECYDDLSQNNRIARFNPIKKLKSILFSKDEKDKDDDAGGVKFRLPDYDLINPGVEAGALKHIKSDKVLSVDEIKKQIPNISDIYFENEAKVKSTQKHPSFSYKLDRNDQDLLYDYNGNKGKPSAAKEAKDKQTTKSLAKPSDSTSSTDVARKKLLQKIHTPSRNLITVNVKTIEQVKTTESTTTEPPTTLDTASTETTLSTIEEIALSLNNMLSTLKQGTVVDIPLKTVRFTPKHRTVDIPRKTTITPNYERERITAKFKKQISIIPPMPKELSEGVFIKTKLTRFAKFPIKKRHYKANKILSEPGNDPRFGEEFMEFFRDFKNTMSSAERKKTSKAQPKSHTTKTPKPNAIDKTKYTDYFNDLVLWHNDILNLDAVPNPLWKDIMNTIEPQGDSPTTPNMTKLLMELNELKDEIDESSTGSSTLEFNKGILNSKEQVFKRENKLGKDSEIRSVAMDDNTLVTSEDMLIKGEAKYFQYINPEPTFPQLDSRDFIAKFDNLNIMNDNSEVDGKGRPKYSVRIFENQSEPAFFLDTTLMAYDDEVDSIVKNLNDKEMSMLLQKKSAPLPKLKYNDHSTIMKTYKAPIQRYTTPLPMAAHDFNKFLKENSMDVEYVTSPIMKLPTIQKLTPKRPVSTAKTTYTRSVRPTTKSTTTKTTTVSTTTTRRQNVLTKQLVKFTKALSVFKPSNLTNVKRAFWEDIDRIKRYTDLSKTHNCEAAKSYTTPQEGNYYNILKKKMKEKLFEKKETAAVERSSKASLSPDPHKPVEITIINFDDIEKMTHQPFGSFALPAARKDELITFLEYPETSTEARKHVDATKGKIPTNKEENVHNELLYKDIFKDLTTSTYSPYTTVDFPQTTEVPNNPIFDEPPVVTYHKVKYPYERVPTYPTIFNKVPHADVPKRVHISSHHYKYDIFYDDQGQRRRLKKPKYVADGLSQAALTRKTTVLPAKVTKGMPITHRRIPNSDKDKNNDAGQKIYKRDCEIKQKRQARGTKLRNQHRMQISLRRYNPKPHGSLIDPRPDIELKSPILNQDDLFRSWHHYPTTTSLYNETLVSEIWHKTPILSLLDNATENYETWHQDPMSSMDKPTKISEIWQKDTIPSKEEANLGFESLHNSLLSEHNPSEMTRTWLKDPASSAAVYTTVVSGIRDKYLDNPAEKSGTWRKGPVSSTTENFVSETYKHTFLSAVNKPTEVSETWPKDPISLSSENTLATQILHQDPMTSTVDKTSEIYTDTWLKNFISSTVENMNSVSEQHKDTTTLVEKLPELLTWRKNPIEKNSNLPSELHKDILAAKNPTMSESWPKDTFSLSVKNYNLISKTRPKEFKSDAGGMVARLDKLALGGKSSSDLDLAKLRYFHRSPFFTMFTIRHRDTGRPLHKPAPNRPSVKELRLLKRTIGTDKPRKEDKEPNVQSNERNRRLFKISALLPKRLKNLMRNISTTTKHGKTNTTTVQIETTTTLQSLTDKPHTENVIEESTENVKLAEPTPKDAQKNIEVLKAPAEISTEEIVESTLPNLLDPPITEPKEPKPPNVKKIQKELEDEKGEGFSFSYHPSHDASQSEESSPTTNAAIASPKRPPDSTALGIVIKDEAQNQQHFYHHHANPPDKTFKCKGKLMHNTASDVIFIEPPAPWFSDRQYTPLKHPPTVPTKSTTTTEEAEAEDEDWVEHNDVKREARQLNTYTAKDVAALEVVVDLMKNTLSYEESNNSPRGSNIAAPFETKSLHNINGSTNSIQVHIAIPFDFQKGQKRSDRDVLSMNPVRVRKVFSAKMSSPVDLEYQVHSFEGTIQATPSETNSSNHLTEQVSTGLTPGMYLLIDKPKNNGYALKPVLGQISYSDLNTRQVGTGAGAGTTAGMVRPKTTETREETTSMKSLGKVTLSKDFIAVVNQKLIEMYENMSRGQDVMNKRSERSVWPHKQKKEATKTNDKYMNSRCIDWEAVKKYFGHDRVCNCKCRCNKTMCNICAASDAVIDELIFEFDNIGKYMADHCTEIQTFFWMNPVAGQKLRDSVNKIDKSLTDYYKRVKGKCQGKLCKAYGRVDKRSFSKTTKIKKEDPVSYLINNLAVLAEDINKTTALKVRYNNKFKEKGDEFLGLMNRYIMKKSFDKRSYPPYTTTPKKVVKNVYSLDNINVNIICNPEVESKTDVPLTLSAAMPFLRDLKENTSKPYDEIVDYELQKIKRKGLKKLFPRKSKKSKLFYFDFGKSTKSTFKRQVNQMEKPLISDGGGEFWYEYLKSGTDELRSLGDSVKDKSNIEIQVVEKHGDGATTVQNLNAKESNTSIVTNLMNMTMKTTSEVSKHSIETTTESLIYSIDRLLWLLGSLPDIDAMNKNSSQSVMILGNLTKNQKEEPIEFLDENKINVDTATFTEQDEPIIYKTGTNMYTTIAASIATAFKCPKKSLLDQKLAEISTIEQALDSATRAVTTTYKGILQEDISRTENPLYTVVITTKPAYSSPSKSMLFSSKLTTKLLTTETQKKPVQNATRPTTKVGQNATKATTKVSTKTVQLASKQTKTTKTIPTLKTTKKIVPTTKAITVVKSTTTTKKTTTSTVKSTTPTKFKETESTTPFFTVKTTTLKTCFMDKLKTASMRFFNKVTESNRHKAEIEATTQNDGLTAIDLFDGKSIEMDYAVGQPKTTTQDPSVVVLNNYDDQFSSENTDKEGYKSLLLSIIQFETNNLNDEWDVVAYGADKSKFDKDSKRNVINLSKAQTTKPTTTLPPDSMYIGSEYDTSNKGKTTKKKPEGLLNKIVSKMGLKIIPTKKKVANKQTVRGLDRGKYMYNRKRSRYNTFRQAPVTDSTTTAPRFYSNKYNSKKANENIRRSTLSRYQCDNHNEAQRSNGILSPEPNPRALFQEACYPGPKSKANQMCDMQATYDHIEALQATVPAKAFERLVKNISCYKFKDANPFFTIPYKRKGKRWDWIRSKRTAKLHFYRRNLDDDDEAVRDFDDPVDSFERFAKGDDGIYKVIDRRKRTANFEALDRGLRNIPPLVPGENELNVVVGDSVTLDCGRTSVRNCDGKFLWKTDRPGMLEQDNVDMGSGSITIHDVKAKNAGTYTCLLDHSVRKKTKLSVLAVPSFDIVFLPVYRIGKNCSYDDLEAIQRLGSLMANEINCGKACSIRIDEPVCQRDRGTNSSLVRAIAVMSMTPRALNCSFQCKRDIITSLVMLGATNTAVLSSIGVLVSIDGVNQTLTPWRELVRPVVTRSLRRKDSNGHHEYHTLVTSLYPGKVDVVIICPSGYYLLPEYKLCASCPPNTSSKAGENTCRVCPRGYRADPGANKCYAKHHRRYDWWWYPPGGYLVAGGGVVLGCSACVILSVIVDLVSRDPDALKCEGCNDVQKSPKPVTSVTVAYARTARSRPLSPSRVILPRFFRPSLTSSRATDSQETKFELWKERNIAPPLPPIDFDP